MALHEDVQAAIQQIKDAPAYQRVPMEPIHPRFYAHIQADLGTTEPLTEQQVIEWACDLLLNGKGS